MKNIKLNNRNLATGIIKDILIFLVIFVLFIGIKVTINELQKKHYYFPEEGYIGNKVEVSLISKVNIKKLDENRKKLYKLLIKPIQWCLLETVLQKVL